MVTMMTLMNYDDDDIDEDIDASHPSKGNH